MSASLIFGIAPLGSLISYSDGSPKPPARFSKKLAAWERRNGLGRLVRKVPERERPTYTVPPCFTSNEGSFGRDDIIVMTVTRTYGVDSDLTFRVVERPRVGQVRIIQTLSESDELLHLAEDQDAAELWLAKSGSRNARLEPVCADTVGTDVVEDGGMTRHPATLVPDERRPAFLPRLFGMPMLIVAENTVYAMMDSLSPHDYGGGHWDFSEDRGQPLFLAPTSKPRFRIEVGITCFEGEVSAEASWATATSVFTPMSTGIRKRRTSIRPLTDPRQRPAPGGALLSCRPRPVAGSREGEVGRIGRDGSWRGERLLQPVMENPR